MLLCRQAFGVFLSQTTSLALSEIRLGFGRAKGHAEVEWCRKHASRHLQHPKQFAYLTLELRPHRPVSPQPSILSFVSLSHSSFKPKPFSPAVRGRP